MIRRRNINLGPNVSPQAIIWRPIRYFSDEILDDEDDLDRFRFVSYAIDNDVFDLRTYLGHPEITVTLYFPRESDVESDIQTKISKVIDILAVPQAAVAWRRGEEFNFGELNRKANDRLKEAEARILVLKIAASSDGHAASTSLIKRAVPDLYPLSPQDLKWSETRKNEKIWQQIIRNVKVHYKGASSIFSRGWAVRTNGGIRVTDEGLIYLKSIGFSSD